MRLVFSLILGTALGCVLILTGCNSAEQKKVASAAAPGTAQPAPPTVVADGVRRVTPTELRDMLAKNEAVVIDVRNAEAYNAAHVQGAKLIPEAEVANRSGELPKNKLIVTYCS